MKTIITIVALGAVHVPSLAQVESTGASAHLEFALTVLRTRTMLEGAEGGDGAAERAPAESTSRWRIGLRPGSVRMLDLDASVETVIDRESERLILLEHGKQRCRTRSLLGWIAGLDQEHAQRQRLAKVPPESSGDAATSLSTFWLESIGRFGEQAAGELEFIERDGGLACTRGEQRVLVTFPGGPDLSPRLHKEYALFWIRMFQIHPTIRARLVAADALPNRVRFLTYDIDHRTDTELRISPWPPAAGEPVETMNPEEAMSTYSAWIDRDDPLDDLFVDIAARRTDVVTTTQEEYIARVKARIEAGRHMDAMLVLLEGTYSHPDFPSRTLASVVDVQSEDAAPLKGFLRPRKTAEEHSGALAAMRAISREDLQGATTLDILTATALANLQRFEESEDLFFDILREKPWLVGPFMDLGQTYAHRSMMAAAWRCWEHAYRLAPNHPMVQAVPERQARLREKYADWL